MIKQPLRSVKKNNNNNNVQVTIKLLRSQKM